MIKKVTAILLLLSVILNSTAADTEVWPNDPLILPEILSPDGQYHIWAMDWPSAWYYAKGHALIGVQDSGIDVGHSDLSQVSRSHMSWSFSAGIQDVNSTNDEHGSIVVGTIAADTNNQEGVAGLCWHCSITHAMHGLASTDPWSFFAGQGIQVASLSWGGTTEVLNCDNNDELCLAIADAYDKRDMVIVSVATNRGANDPVVLEVFPASLPEIIQVGGLEFDSNTSEFGFWDDCDEPNASSVCGSYSSSSQELVAPAKNILSTVPENLEKYSRCDEVPLYLDPKYDICSGTSFAGPQVAALAGIIRSIYPQLSAPNVRELLKATATSPHMEHNPEWGWGMIDPLLAVKNTLGVSGGMQQVNRVIPMFNLYDSQLDDILQTVVPQVAAAAILGDYRVRGDQLEGSVNYQNIEIGMSLQNYTVPATDINPHAPFFVLAEYRNPNDDQELVRLYRMSKIQYDNEGKVNELTHATIPENYVDLFVDQGFVIDKIEGYLLPCDKSGSCSKPTATECVVARASEKDNWALMLASQTQTAQYENYSKLLPKEDGTASEEEICLGLAYQPVDTDQDRLVDGYEALLKTELQKKDTDNDGLSDGQEMLDMVNGGFSDPLDTITTIITPKQGLYWSPNASGHGYQLAMVSSGGGEELVVFVYTYDEANDNETQGAPTWYLSDGAKIDGNVWEAPLRRYHRNVEGEVSNEIVGSLRIDFNNDTSGTMSWELTDIGLNNGSESIERFIFGGEVTNLTGAYADLDELGYGITVDAQAPTSGMVLYYYDESGHGRWVLGVDDDKSGDYEMLSYRGYCLSCPMTEITSEVVGEVMVNDVSDNTLGLDIDITYPGMEGGDWMRSDITMTRLTLSMD